MNNKISRYKFQADTSRGKATLYAVDTSIKDNFTYEVLDSARLHFYGVFQSDTLDLWLQRKGPEDFLLVNRGFHWINERPYNR